MELSNEFEVGVGVAEAWAVLTDVERIAPCLPGAQLSEIDGDEFHGSVKVKVGPITAQYRGKAHFVELDERAHRVVLTASGQDTRGQGTASATVTAQLSAEGDRRTHVSVLTDLALTGKVAQFGRGVLADVSAKLIEQFVDNLSAEVLGAPAADPTGDAPPAADAAARRRVDGPPAEPIDLLSAAGSPVAQRVLPLLGVGVAALVVYGLVKRRRRG